MNVCSNSPWLEVLVVSLVLCGLLKQQYKEGIKDKQPYKHSGFQRYYSPGIRDVDP
jgi:hypothetical protein